ncbi:stemmadenine O-acetyltransferase-like [Tripterygium wilfordii]|uniref:stemmadenine O-acetyltransferase-like n=1 Tax=Tripterygium wilfordii TaxID=458696 RepID=UPI0018F7E8E3|nr:stemmadenine O-acetyltransferase-like [Tripterygium wilfordii]
MKVKILARETIKPSSPTPNHLKISKISLLDQLSMIEYTPFIYFYPANGHYHDNERSMLLKISLSKTLTLYYPFAGRFRDNTSIECNDKGVEFVEARVIDCVLSDIIQQPDIKQLQELLPVEVESKAAATGSLLVVQANFFKCGGMAIAICLSHRVADGLSFFTFVNTWASMAHNSAEDHNVVQPQFSIGPSLFPPLDSSLPPFEFPRGKCIMRRFVFDGSSIAALKGSTASSTVQRPSKAEAVTALLWKCAIAASSSVHGVLPRQSICYRAVDLRRRFSPRLSDYAVGNLLASVGTRINVEKWRDLNLKTLLHQLRKAMQEFKIKEGENLIGEPNEETERKESVHHFACTTLRGMPMYEADFGWGKPIWASVTSLLIPNMTFIRDTRDGDGIEALVWLGEEEMAMFERNKELLAFATLDPNILQQLQGSCNTNSISKL